MQLREPKPIVGKASITGMCGIISQWAEREIV